MTNLLTTRSALACIVVNQEPLESVWRPASQDVQKVLIVSMAVTYFCSVLSALI